MYIDKKDLQENLENFHKGDFYAPKSEEFRGIINNLNFKNEGNNLRVKLSLFTFSKDKTLYFKKEDVVEPTLISGDIKEIKEADVLTHLILTLQEMVLKHFGADFCNDFMKTTTLIPYGFYLDNYLYICYGLYMEKEVLEKLVNTCDNAYADTLENIKNFSNMTKRGRMIIQPFIKNKEV